MSTSMLSVRQLHVSRGGKPVVHGVDLDVAAGEIVAKAISHCSCDGSRDVE